MNAPTSIPADAELALPESGIFVKNGKLVRVSAGGLEIAALELSRIREIRARRSINWNVILFVLVCLGAMWAVGRYDVPPPWSLIIQIPIGLVIAIALFAGGIETELLILSQSGQVSFSLNESDPSNAVGFVLSVRERLKKS